MENKTKNSPNVVIYYNLTFLYLINWDAFGRGFLYDCNKRIEQAKMCVPVPEDTDFFLLSTF